MRAAGLKRSKGGGARIGCALDIDFRRVDVAADQYFMDRSVYGHKCQAKNGAHWHGDGWDFDGTDDAVDCGVGASLHITGALTCECLISYTQVAAQITEFMGNEAANKGYLINADSSKCPGFAFYIPSAWKGCTSPEALSEGIRHHLVGVWDGFDEMRLYVDKEQKKATTGVSGSIVHSGQNFYIAKWYSNNARCQDGLSIHVRVWNFADYAARILQRAIDSRRN